MDTSNRWFETNLDTDKIDFKAGPVFNLTPDQLNILASNYKGEEDLYFKGQPPFSDLLDGLKKIHKTLK